MQNFESIVGVNFWTALFTLCNMLITFLILKKLLFKPVKKMIDDRQKEIADQYAEAERRRQEAEQAKLAYDQEIAQAKQKRDEIVREAASLPTARSATFSMPRGRRPRPLPPRRTPTSARSAGRDSMR